MLKYSHDVNISTNIIEHVFSYVGRVPGSIIYNNPGREEFIFQYRLSMLNSDQY